MITINKDTAKSNKKFFLDQILSSLPKKNHDEIIAKILPKLTSSRYETIRNWRNINMSEKRDMPATAYLTLCKFFEIDPFEGINIDLPTETISNLEIELEEDLVKKFGLTVK